jgi:glycosyltransferase involved in cell wall biosynthesis
MIRSVEVKSTTTLEDYNGVAHLAGAVQELRAEAATLVPQLQGRSVCMVNSSAQGGGVAEMLPKLVGTLRELGVDAQWLVMGSSDEAFFKLTKRIHNLIHGAGDPELTSEERALYESVSSLKAAYCALSPEFQEDIALVTLPMQSRKENALMANALQTCSTIVVQNSLREGFGLTVTEAMWKGTAVLGSSACGIRQQIRDRIDGRLTADPECPEEIAMNLDTMLDDEFARDRWGRSAQKRVLSEFLLFNQVARWLRVLCHRSNVSGQSLPG